ncbi:hypothetical protein [Clostridium sp. UBA6640]|uniref:hypothetical protein n=1 Tax=Clostridium sp. UBA6640 TaxID=1946370 RepID=UPI0025BC18EE|nr:hypothetical protein [Clostridium sp. UBA6640]
MIDGMREETRGWGNNKKLHTIIELPNTTNEHVLTVLKAARLSAKDRANIKKFKAERNTAISDKNTATEERDTAIKAKELTEKQRESVESATKKAEEKAKS